MQENWCSRYEDFIIMQFLNTTRVPKMAHPTENVLRIIPLLGDRYSGGSVTR